MADREEALKRHVVLKQSITIILRQHLAKRRLSIDGKDIGEGQRVPYTSI